MKSLKLQLIALGLLLAFSGSVFAGSDVPLVVNDGDPDDTSGPADNIISVQGTIDPIDIAGAFSMTIVGQTSWFDSDGNRTIFDLGEPTGNNLNPPANRPGDPGLPGFANEDILFHVGVADGGDATPLGGATFSGANNANDASDVRQTDPLKIYSNVLRKAADGFTETSIYVANNLGAGFSVAMDFQANATTEIWTIETPAAGLTFPINTQYFATDGETWDGTNDGPIHVTVIPTFDSAGAVTTIDQAGIFSTEETIGGIQPVVNDPVAVNSTNTTVDLFDTNNIAGDSFTVITAMDFVNLNPSGGTYGGNVVWTLDSKLV